MVSIIIVNFNTFSLTCECISTLIAHTTNIAYEIILVDNGSKEKDPALFKEKFPFIQLIISAENLGFAKGNNLGIHQAKGDFILLLNSDIIFTENVIHPLVHFLLSTPKAGIVSPKLLYPDGTMQYVAERFPSIKMELLNLVRGYKMCSRKKAGQLFLSYHFDHNSSIAADYVWGAFFLFKKELLQHFPGQKLNDEFFMYAEDMLWCYEARQAGYEAWYMADAKAIHYHSYSLSKAHVKSSDKKAEYTAINKYRFLKSKKGKFYSAIYLAFELLNRVSRAKFKQALTQFKAYKLA